MEVEEKTKGKEEKEREEEAEARLNSQREKAKLPDGEKKERRRKSNGSFFLFHLSFSTPASFSELPLDCLNDPQNQLNFAPIMSDVSLKVSLVENCPVWWFCDDSASWPLGDRDLSSGLSLSPSLSLFLSLSLSFSLFLHTRARDLRSSFVVCLVCEARRPQHRGQQPRQKRYLCGRLCRHQQSLGKDQHQRFERGCQQRGHLPGTEEEERRDGRKKPPKKKKKKKKTTFFFFFFFSSFFFFFSDG